MADGITAFPFDGVLRLDGWAGRTDVPVQVVGETSKRYRIKLMHDTRLPGRREGRAGDVVLVPKYAIGRNRQGDING